MGYTWLGMRKLTWEEVLQRHEKDELAGCFRLYDDNSEAMIDRGCLLYTSPSPRDTR